jgi:transcriptional regulator with XRE-family HTH domain
MGTAITQPGGPSSPPNLVAERIRRGLGLVDTAKRIGVSINTLRRAENGERVHSKCVAKIARFYDLDPFALHEGLGERPGEVNAA